MSDNGKNGFEIETLMGYTVGEAYRVLAAPLPPTCYTDNQQGFTDIDPVARDVVFNQLFGPCGVGWAYDYDASAVQAEEFSRGNKKNWTRAYIPRLTVRFRWVINGELVWSEPLPMVGYHENRGGKGYAGKGASTSAITGAASHILFQQMVYMGRLDHKNAPAAYAKYGPHPFEDALVSAGLTANGSDNGSEKVEVSEQPEAKVSASAAAPGDSAGVRVHFGKNKGAALGDLPTKSVRWYANPANTGVGFNPQDARGKALQKAAREVLKAREAESDPVQEVAEELNAETVDLASEPQARKVFDLLAQLGYEGDRASKALSSRGYDPEALSAEQAAAIVEKLSAQIAARKAAA